MNKTGFVVLTSSTAALGGLIFGYDTAIIADAILFLNVKFHLGPAESGWVVSSVLIGAMVGAAATGKLSDTFGRKRMLIVSGILFAAGAVGSAFAPDVSVLIAARVVCGFGIGMAGLLAPVYIAETAPARIRGRLVSIYQLAIGSGQLVAYCVGAVIIETSSHAFAVATGWRWMLGLGCAPAIVFLLLLFFTTESPRWLEKQGRTDEALSILTRSNESPETARAELEEIKVSVAEEGISFRQLLKPGLRTVVLIGVVIAFLQQWSGINAITYYAPKIFESSGAGSNSYLDTVLLGVVNVGFTCAALWLMDRAGRRRLFLVGTACMTITLTVVGFAFYTGTQNGSWVLIFILLYMAVFMATVGSGLWVLLSEIFPNRMRSQGVAIATVTLWLADYIVSQIFPVLLADFGGAVTFWIFAGGSVCMFLFTFWMIPETRHRTLEQIETLFGIRQGQPAHPAGHRASTAEGGTSAGPT